MINTTSEIQNPNQIRSVRESTNSERTQVFEMINNEPLSLQSLSTLKLLFD